MVAAGAAPVYSAGSWHWKMRHPASGRGTCKQPIWSCVLLVKINTASHINPHMCSNLFITPRLGVCSLHELRPCTTLQDSFKQNTNETVLTEEVGLIKLLRPEQNEVRHIRKGGSCKKVGGKKKRGGGDGVGV